MQFGGDVKRRPKYPLRVQLYDKPPEDDISLEEFYLLGKKRMEGRIVVTLITSLHCEIVLRAVERFRQDSSKDKTIKELNANFPDWTPVSLNKGSIRQYTNMFRKVNTLLKKNIRDKKRVEEMTTSLIIYYF